MTTTTTADRRVGTHAMNGLLATRDDRRGRRGFTLIEVLIVVVILGILAAMVVPLIADLGRDASKNSFATSGRGFVEAAQRYQMMTGQFPVDGSTGQVPAGFDDYVNPIYWTQTTPIGGSWDAENDGISASIGVHFNNGDNPGDEFMLEIDEAIDDGDLSSGHFRQIAADRYYWILDE